MKGNDYLDNLMNTPLENIDLDTFPGFEQRNTAGEFKNMTNDQIKRLFIEEAIDQSHQDELQDHHDSLDDED